MKSPWFLLPLYLLACLNFSFAAKLSYNSGTTCSYVNQSPKQHAEITLKTHQISTKVPVLIFRYKHILNFANIPTVEEWFSSYGISDSEKENLYQGAVDFENNKFIVESYKEAPIDNLFNGYIGDNHVEVSYTVPDSGIYCVYIAPPTGTTENIKIDAIFKQAHGNLPYLNYVYYSQQKYIFLLGLVIFGYLLNYILRFKVDTHYSDLNSISLISKAVIFFVLLPFTLLAFVQMVTGFVENHIGSRGFIFQFLDLINPLLNSGFQLSIQFFTLLFAMGYGVIYYHEGGSRNYRVLPAKYSKIAFTLYIIGLSLVVLFTVGGAVLKSPWGYLSDGDNVLFILTNGANFSNSQISRNTVLFFSSVLAGIGIITAAFFFCTIYFYFQTKKSIVKFPPSSESDTNDKIIKSYRRSVLVIFVLPFFVAIAGAAFSMYRGLASGVFEDLPEMIGQRPATELSAMSMIGTELGFSSAILLPSFWTQWANFFLTVILLFFIWIKDNNGLIVDKFEISDTARFDVESEDDELTL